LDVDIWVNKGDDANYYYGDDIAVFFEANRDAYVVVYDVDPAGNISLLFPANYDTDCFVRAGQVYRIPGADDSYRLEVNGPSGREYIYAVASYNYIRPPDFLKYAFYDYGDRGNYNDEFIYRLSGDRVEFIASLNNRIVDGPYVQSSVMLSIDDNYRHSRWYRHWRYDPYYVGSMWIGADWPGCEVWIDGCYYGIAPILIPNIYFGHHWVWMYYGGYPCWNNYVNISHGQRYYVDAKIDRRGGRFGGHGDNGGGKYDHRGGDKGRRWDLKQDKYRNERDFRTELVKHPSDNRTPSKQLPPSWVAEKYTQKHESDGPIGQPSKGGSIDKFRPSDETRRSKNDNRNSNDSYTPIRDDSRRSGEKSGRSGDGVIRREPNKTNSDGDNKSERISTPSKQSNDTPREIRKEPRQTTGDNKSERISTPSKQSNDTPKEIRRESKQTSNPPAVKSEPVRHKQESPRSSEKQTQTEKRGKR
jgi:hypothetical protein